MSVSPENLKQAMRRWATGVAIVSAYYNGVQHGMTVNSFTSVALTPPLILVSLEQATRTYQLVSRAGYFGVTILSSYQKDLAQRFAGGYADDQNRFADLPTHTLTSGAPFLVNGLAWFDCNVAERLALGTHTVFVGEVIALQIHENPQALVYINRDYRELGL
jgi:flavin reductase (DIM6/NTAB) family NADH-FMN oxidoreductase RutF